MVKFLKQESEDIYICEECGYRYKEKETAEKCEAWCRENHSCNLEIIKHGEPPA